MPRDRSLWQEDLYEIGEALADAAPAGWRRVDLCCRVTVDVQDFALAVVMADGGRAVAAIPDLVPAAVVRMRKAFHRPEDGTWFAMRYMLTAPGKISVAYNTDWDPRLAGDPAMWVRELAAFPRQPAHIPPWLRAKLTEAGHAVPDGEPLARDEDWYWARLANLVVLSVPLDWAEVSLTYQVAEGRPELAVTVQRTSDDSWEEWEPPPEVAELLAGLRASLHQGRGPWRHVEARIDPGSGADYSYTWDPPTRSYAGEVDPAEPLRSAERAATELAVPPSRYRIGEIADGALCLVHDGDWWVVFEAEGGERRGHGRFATAEGAARNFVARLYRRHTAFWAELPPEALRPTADWPIQPVGGDAPLQTYGGKQLVILPPGTEMDRYGDPASNTLYVAGTKFPERSEPDEVLATDFHVYRLRGPVRAIAGTAIPWYDQPGGGTAYVLEHPVAHYLATNAIEEITPVT